MEHKVVRSAPKTVAILKSFSPSSLELGISDISRRSGVPKATVHRLVGELVENGFLEQNQISGKYHIGPDLYYIGNLYVTGIDFLNAAIPVMKKLNNITEEAIIIGTLKLDNIMVLMKEESPQYLKYTYPIGTNVPAHASAIGKALLSELPEKEIDDLYRSEALQQLSPHTISTKTELKRDLENIKKTGVSIDNEGSGLGVVGIASVIRTRNGHAEAAIAIATPSARMNPYKIRKTSELVKLGARIISHRLGYRVTDSPINDLQDIDLMWKQNKWIYP